MARADSRCADCRRAESSHPWDSVETGESCAAFVQRVVDPVRSKVGKQSRRRGIQAQREANLAAGFTHRTGTGEDGVYYAPDGTVLLIGESKRKLSMPAFEIEKALQQAESYAVHERGKPKACVLWTTVGRPSRKYLIVRAEEWPDIASRLMEGGMTKQENVEAVRRAYERVYNWPGGNAMSEVTTRRKRSEDEKDAATAEHYAHHHDGYPKETRRGCELCQAAWSAGNQEAK